MNKASQQPKGTAFVEYWDTSAAAAAAAACQKARYTHLPLFQPRLHLQIQLDGVVLTNAVMQ